MTSERVRQLVEQMQLETDPARMTALAAALGAALDHARELEKQRTLARPTSTQELDDQ